MIASNPVDECDEDDFLPYNIDNNRNDDNDNPLDALNRLKEYIEQLDAEAERVQHEIANAIKDYGNDSDNDNSVSALDLHGITTDFLASIQDKENDGKQNPAPLQNSGAYQGPILSPLTSSQVTKTPSHRRTPLQSKEQGANILPTGSNEGDRFSFNTDQNPALAPDPVATLEHHQTPRQDDFCHEMPLGHLEIHDDLQLSPSSIRIESPVKSNDPYEWAYAVWREHGLMGRTGETPKCKVDMHVTVSSPSSLFHSADVTEWDLSPLTEYLMGKRKSSVTKGADRAKEFARQSTGNFQNVLSTWRKGHMEDTPSRNQAQDVARLKKREDFQELLRKWREARQELAASGQKRAMMYASEAKTNLQGILKIWHDSQAAEFEHWAQEHARSPDEFHELLSKWKHTRVGKRTKDAANEHTESHCNMDEVMKHWRDSHATEFEDWAREQSHSSDEFQELLRQWREALPGHASSIQEVQETMPRQALPHLTPLPREITNSEDVIRSSNRKMKNSLQSDEAHVVRSPTVQPTHPIELQEKTTKRKEESSEVTHHTNKDSGLAIGRLDRLLSRWRLAEARSFNGWARQQTSSKSEFQSLLQKWRDGKPTPEERKETFTFPGTCETFENVLTMWRQSETYDFEEWAKGNAASSKEFDLLMQKWKDAGAKETLCDQNDNTDAKREFDVLVSRWREAERPKFHKWARQNSCCKEDFHALVNAWRDSNPLMTSDQPGKNGSALSDLSKANFEEIKTMWQESGVFSFEDWVPRHSSSPSAFQHILKLWKHHIEDETTSRWRSLVASDLDQHVRSTTRSPFQSRLRALRLTRQKHSSMRVRALDLADPIGSVRSLENTSTVWSGEQKPIKLERETPVRNEDSTIPADSMRLEALNLEVLPISLRLLERFENVQTSSRDDRNEESGRRQRSEMQKKLRRWREDGPDFARSNFPLSLDPSGQRVDFETLGERVDNEDSSRRKGSEMQSILRRWREDGPDFASDNSVELVNVESQTALHLTGNTSEALPHSADRPFLSGDDEPLSEMEAYDHQTPVGCADNNLHPVGSPKMESHQNESFARSNSGNQLCVQYSENEKHFRSHANKRTGPIDRTWSERQQCEKSGIDPQTKTTTKRPFQSNREAWRLTNQYCTSVRLKALDLAEPLGSVRRSQNSATEWSEERQPITFTRDAASHDQVTATPAESLRFDALDLAVKSIPFRLLERFEDVRTSCGDDRNGEPRRRQSSDIQKLLRRWREDGPDFACDNTAQLPNVESQIPIHPTENTSISFPRSTEGLCVPDFARDSNVGLLNAESLTPIPQTRKMSETVPRSIDPPRLLGDDEPLSEMEACEHQRHVGCTDNMIRPAGSPKMESPQNEYCAGSKSGNQQRVEYHDNELHFQSLPRTLSGAIDRTWSVRQQCETSDLDQQTPTTTKSPYRSRLKARHLTRQDYSTLRLRALDLADLNRSAISSQNMSTEWKWSDQQKPSKFTRELPVHDQDFAIAAESLQLEALDLAVLPLSFRFLDRFEKVQTSCLDDRNEELGHRQSSDMQKILRRWRKDGPDFACHNSDGLQNVESHTSSANAGSISEASPRPTDGPCQGECCERQACDHQSQAGCDDSEQHFGSLIRMWTEASPLLRTGEHRAEEFARDSSGNFSELVSNWSDTKNTPNRANFNGKRRAQECLQSSTGKVNKLISTWKTRPSHLEGLEEGQGIGESNEVSTARNVHQVGDDSDATSPQPCHQGYEMPDKKGELITKLKSWGSTWNQHSAESTLNRDENNFSRVADVIVPIDATFGEDSPDFAHVSAGSSFEPPNELSGNVNSSRKEDQTGNDCNQTDFNSSRREIDDVHLFSEDEDELITYWKSKVNAPEGGGNYGGSPRISERSVAWEKDVVTDVKLFSDEIPSDEDSTSSTRYEIRGRTAEKYFEGLINNVTCETVAVKPENELVVDFGLDTGQASDDVERKGCGCETSSKSEVQDTEAVQSTGKLRAAQYALDARTDFEALKTNWSLYETQNKTVGVAEGSSKESIGKQRAAEFALGATTDFCHLRTSWCKDQVRSGQDVPDDKLSQSAGKQRAQEFASNASVAIRDLMDKWSDKHYSSLDFQSPCALHQPRSVPRMTPIKDFIAALSAGHAPMLESISSSEERDEIESLFDDVDVAHIAIPEGEDPIVAPNGHLRSCACASSNFSGADKLVEFFLPQLGMACTCGKDAETFPDPEVQDPSSIDMILRPWQCEFLKSFGIHRGDQLVKAYHRSAGILAKAMKKWRKKHNMVRARTVSCGLALHIWSKVCKIYIRSIRRQIASGVEVVRPPTTMTVLSQLLTQGDRRVTVPHSGRKHNPPELIDANSEVEI